MYTSAGNIRIYRHKFDGAKAYPQLFAKRCVDRQDFLRPQGSKKLVGVVLEEGRRLIRALAEAGSNDGRQEGFQHPHVSFVIIEQQEKKEASISDGFRGENR